MPELNMDGLVGPTHHYAGLSQGNIASVSNALRPANPMAAALQGIAKMRLLVDAGIPQAILPPHERPNLALLRNLGFEGRDDAMLARAAREAPALLSAAFSASAMWAANAATIAPSCDTEDALVHISPANLVTNLHRHQEAGFSGKVLKRIFARPDHFHHHPPLAATAALGDEGAANHNRICPGHDKAGIHLFVYGKQAIRHDELQGPFHYPARQTLEASMAIARRHRLSAERVHFARQNPKAIDGGVFHNDVIATVNESVLLIHEDAFVDEAPVLRKLQDLADFPLTVIRATHADFTLRDAVESYLFNSQILTLPHGRMMLLAPTECQENQRVYAFIASFLADSGNPVDTAVFRDLKQSMRNGGGPACLRLRVPLNNAELGAIHQGVMATPTRLDALETWVRRHYRDRLLAEDLASSAFVRECREALDALTTILDLGALYPFQQEP